MKYIHFKYRGYVVFEETQSHKEMAKMIGDEVISAGFVHSISWCDDGKLVVSGKSETLSAEPHPDDQATLRRRFDRS